MDNKEILHLGIAWIALALVIEAHNLFQAYVAHMGMGILFAFLILGVSYLSKKVTASALDADVEHELWMAERYGFKPDSRLTKEIPLGVIVSLVLSIFSLGIVKCMTLLTYRTSALKRRAAQRFGNFSFTEMTDWHNALVGAGGIGGVLILASLAYVVPALEGLPSVAVYYAFWNMIPWSKLDGAQIYMGSRVLYITLALITLVFTCAALLVA